MKSTSRTHKQHLLLLLCLALLALTFVVVKIHAASVFDEAVVKALYGLRGPVGIAVFSGLTSLGDTLSVGLALLAACLALLVSRRHKSYIVGLVVAVGGAKLSEVLMKILIERARPDGFALFHLDSYSFPSGHATGAMALYGFITYILCALYPRQRAAWVALGGTVILGVGMSRIYLGVHFPSDVLGGFLLGAIWILVGISAVKYWRS